MSMDGDTQGKNQANIATLRQPTPSAGEADVTELAKKDLASYSLLAPVEGLMTVYLWIRSAAAHLHADLNHIEGRVFTREGLVNGLIRDLELRAAMGEAKYGTRLRTRNGRDPRVDLYQELLDALVYLRQHLEEQKTKK